MGKVEDPEITQFLAAWLEVRQLIQAANFNHFHQAGLSATQFMVLNLLPEKGDGIAIGELARRMNLKPATVVKTVDSLEERGMLARKKSDGDRRLVLVQITDEGQRLQNSARGQFRRYISDIFSRIPGQDRRQLIKGLESLVQAAKREETRTDGAITHDERGAAPAKRSSRQSLSR
ncbi:MAG: MarR family transcriptional regulator [Acidobacteria bacterium]|nr:MarR family transcriptional regulator [Acidobacteriota bacterium]